MSAGKCQNILICIIQTHLPSAVHSLTPSLNIENFHVFLSLYNLHCLQRKRIKKKVQNGCGLDPLSFTMCSGTVTGPSQSATVMLRKM